MTTPSFTDTKVRYAVPPCGLLAVHSKPPLATSIPLRLMVNVGVVCAP